ncbi:NAD(P)/FAD-dependent oxidoreductase [Peptacetobacter sp.]|uniref:NAD(P)/FAD-dependent oxidoreductase n=1 Tax=Peptacetobacter sp. TaxID=2991975 RepID=UPI002615128E|nr:hypothetical protein [Peptacetobacter sp.]
MLRVSNLKMNIDEDINILKKLILKKLRIKDSDLVGYSIYKESIDARKKDNMTFVYTVDVEIKNEEKILKRNPKDTVKVNQKSYIGVKKGNIEPNGRIVVIGSGPAGLFASLLLAQNGYCPLMIERGSDVDKRTADVENFWGNKVFNKKSNVQFGEGGAGTFSDGKLTTRSKDIRCRKVLEELVLHDAPSEIIYSHKPHVGTDILKNVVKNIREDIKKLGGEVRFESQVTDINIENNSVKSIVINDNEKIDVSTVILAIGHSARDTYEMLFKRGVTIIPKPFAIGARIEHPQEMINKSQYGKYYNHPRLGAADYRLIEHTSNGRTAYTFCMCPGGSVIASTSEENEVVTNGMSEHSRDKENANSALLVNISPEDFESDNPLAGIEFQRKYEKLAFKLGGENYSAPAQLVGDFINNKESKNLGKVIPSYKPGIKLTSLDECLPKFVTETMKEGIIKLGSKLEGFDMYDAVLTGVETRSSAPIRIVRNEETLESMNISNLYPCGEGAGYAGGIVTAAVDGIKCAEKIIEKYKNIQ